MAIQQLNFFENIDSIPIVLDLGCLKEKIISVVGKKISRGLKYIVKSASLTTSFVLEHFWKCMHLIFLKDVKIVRKEAFQDNICKLQIFTSSKSAWINQFTQSKEEEIYQSLQILEANWLQNDRLLFW